MPFLFCYYLDLTPTEERAELLSGDWGVDAVRFHGELLSNALADAVLQIPCISGSCLTLAVP